MRLTLHTDYALRVLIHVAIADGRLTTINDIAESFDISKQHLMKVVNDLSQKGYLDTLRGRGAASDCVVRRAISISAKWCARPRTSSILSAVWDSAVIAGSSASACCAACWMMRFRHFSMSWTDITLADLIKPQRVLSSLLLLDQHAVV